MIKPSLVTTDTIIPAFITLYLWGIGDGLPVPDHGSRPPRQAGLARLEVGIVLFTHTMFACM